MKRNKLILLFTFLLFLGSCSDKLNLKLLEGRYRGYFYYIPPGETTSGKSKEEVNLDLAGKEYFSGGGSDRIPAGGSGEFIPLNNKEMEFKDKNIWTANFDWNLILNGHYSYELKNDSLILTRYFELKPGMMPGLYQYRLKRLN